MHLKSHKWEKRYKLKVIDPDFTSVKDFLVKIEGLYNGSETKEKFGKLIFPLSHV